MTDFDATRFRGENLMCVRGERIVFRGLDFDLSAGGAVVLIGPNGSGKSSLLRMMAGLLRPALGRMMWAGSGHDVAGGEYDVHQDLDSHGPQLHYVGHHDAVKSVLSVAENIRFWAHLRGRGEAAIQDALAAFDIAHLHEVPGRFLSAGQKRRVNLARIMAAPAPLWLLDEPSTALDKATVKRLEEVLHRHRDGGGMVVLSTHAEINMAGAEVLNLADFTAAASSDEDMWA